MYQFSEDGCPYSTSPSMRRNTYQVSALTGMRLWLTILLLSCISINLLACGSETKTSAENGQQPSSAASAATLPITPTFQQTPVWCWAAAAEMVFRYYQLPNLNQFGNYQCGIVASWFLGTQCSSDCRLCSQPIGVMSNEYSLITQYGVLANNLGVPSRVLSASLIFRALTAQEIKVEIDGRRPIVAGINPGGGFALPNASQHIAVIAGYDFSSETPAVIVNDPFPFSIFPYIQFPHPYLTSGGVQLQQGQYRIPLNSLYTALSWNNSIVGIQ